MEAPQLSSPILDSSISTDTVEQTSWSVKSSCGICGPLVEVHLPNNRSKYFLRHWMCQPLMPIVSMLISFFCFAEYLVVAVPRQYLAIQIISTFLVTITFFLFVWSYFGAVCMDPGFLPFDWARTRRFYYSWQEQLTGFAVTESQINFARQSQNRPPHCSFSSSFGRYVIRADHICGWIANWVGKRNHKQFMLLNLWGGISAILMFAFHFGVKEDLFNLDDIGFMSVQLIGMAFDAAFALCLLGMFCSCLIDLARNRTKIQRMRGEAGETGKYTFRESMEEVCGNGNKCLWCWPTPAFDETLVLTADMPQAPPEDSD